MLDAGLVELFDIYRNYPALCPIGHPWEYELCDGRIGYELRVCAGKPMAHKLNAGDGQLFTFEIDFSQCRLLNRKKISLGNQPIALNTFRSKGAMHVFAASDRPTVIHMNNGKLLYSNVNLKVVLAKFLQR